MEACSTLMTHSTSKPVSGRVCSQPDARCVMVGLGGPDSDADAWAEPGGLQLANDAVRPQVCVTCSALPTACKRCAGKGVSRTGQPPEGAHPRRPCPWRVPSAQRRVPPWRGRGRLPSTGAPRALPSLTLAGPSVVPCRETARVAAGASVAPEGAEVEGAVLAAAVARCRTPRSRQQATVPKRCCSSSARSSRSSPRPSRYALHPCEPLICASNARAHSLVL